jgi:hypothetical protein
MSIPLRPAALVEMVPLARSRSTPLVDYHQRGIPNRELADTGAESIHLRPIEDSISPLEAFLQCGNYRIAEIHAHPFTDLLSQTLGSGILDVQGAASLAAAFGSSQSHCRHSRAISDFRLAETWWSLLLTQGIGAGRQIAGFHALFYNRRGGGSDVGLATSRV